MTCSTGGGSVLCTHKLSIPMNHNLLRAWLRLNRGSASLVWRLGTCISNLGAQSPQTLAC